MSGKGRSMQLQHGNETAEQIFLAGVISGVGMGALVIILGFANLLADGFSMALSNYLGTKSDPERVDQARQDEERHIAQVPEGEREEIRQIFAGKGFSGETLEKIVGVITMPARVASGKKTRKDSFPRDFPFRIRLLLKEFLP